MKDASCIFCKIVAGEAAASIVHRDEHVLAFMDISPVVEGHVLVIPTYHTPDLAGVTEDAGGRMFALGRRVAASLRASGEPNCGLQHASFPVARPNSSATHQRCVK